MNIELISILDRSGSMGHIWSEAVGGYTAFLAEQASMPGNTRATLIVFDDKVDTVYAGVDASNPPYFNPNFYGPRGMTAMRDAIGHALTTHGQRIMREGWADKVIVTIITDGGENSSREYSPSAIVNLVQSAQQRGWSFVFLAANQNAVMAGAGMGIDSAHTYGFTASGAGTREAYTNMSASTRAIRGTTF